MNLTYVNSSNVEGVCIDGNDLIVKFKSGRYYRCKNAACEYSKILNASSKGRYYHAYIKPYYDCVPM